MAETNLNITRVENGFIVEAPSRIPGARGLVKVAETSSAMAALVASWARQFEPAEPVATKIDIMGATPAAPLEVSEGRFYTDANGDVIGPMLGHTLDNFIVRCGDGRVWQRNGKAYTSACVDLVAEVERLAPAVQAPAPLVVREHGIYERSDGKIVGWEAAERMLGGAVYRHKVGCFWYSPNGYYSLVMMGLVREIVVGEGWKPWNGGECPVDRLQTVDVVMRNVTGLSAAKARIYRWDHRQDPGDIVAYHPSTEG